MQEELERIYNECIRELENIKIDIHNPIVGDIDIKIARGNPKRYGCCKQEEPDERYHYTERRKNRLYVKYDRYKKHHIEVSKWVMDMNEEIIKNTIIHEIIHCFPGCNNHGEIFKKYAGYIKQNLGYDISRVGNKKEDFIKSHLEYSEKPINYNYKINCEKCGQTFFRQRLKKNFIRRYRCGKCRRKAKSRGMLKRREKWFI